MNRTWAFQRNSILFSVLFSLLVFIFLVSCTSRNGESNDLDRTSKTPTLDSQSSATPDLTRTDNLQALKTLPPIPAVTRTVAAEEVSTVPAEDETSEPQNLGLLEGCPDLTSQNASLPWAGGSILFGTGLLDNDFAYPGHPEEPGIWAISPNNPEPWKVYDVPPGSPSWANVSPGGIKMLHFNRDAMDEQIVSAQLVDIVTGEISQVSLKDVEEVNWYSDQRVELVTGISRESGVGITKEFKILDTGSLSVETGQVEFELPGYAFDPRDMLPAGYASLEPGGTRMLYTAYENSGVTIILRDTGNGTVYWQEDSRSMVGYPEPEWNSDSHSVLFITYVSNGREEYAQVTSLIDGAESESLPGQPYPQLDREQPRFLTRSSDGRYILYSIWGSIRRGPAYLVDTVSSQVRELCQANGEFMDGKWVSNDQFVYRVLEQVDDTWRQSVFLLDIPSWTTARLYTPSNGYGVNIFGWTPAESS